MLPSSWQNDLLEACICGMSPALLFGRPHAKPKHECQWQTCAQLFKKTQAQLNPSKVQGVCLPSVSHWFSNTYFFCGFYRCDGNLVTPGHNPLALLLLVLLPPSHPCPFPLPLGCLGLRFTRRLLCPLWKLYKQVLFIDLMFILILEEVGDFLFI